MCLPKPMCHTEFFLVVNASPASPVVMRGSRKFCQRGPNLITIFFIFFYFLIDEGIEDPNTTINRPSSARQ